VAPGTRRGQLVLVPSAAMGPRYAIVAGLLAGVGVAVVLLIGLLALAPEPSSPATPAPSIAVSAGSLEPSAGSSVSTSPGAPGSKEPSASSGDAGSGFKVGEPAPGLVVPQLGGGTIDLSLLEGKPVWVSFITTTCQPCLDELGLISGFATRYQASGLVVLAVAVREDEGTVASFAQQRNATVPIGIDGDGQAAQRWGAADLPVDVWVDAQGIVRDGVAGGVGADRMVAGLKRILPGVDVKP
jgi:thiol-disulfide isomerase/thioredoxin